MYTSDFKLGHYMKIPYVCLQTPQITPTNLTSIPSSPRTLFWSQVIATAIAGTVQLGVQSWLFTHVPDLCSPHQAAHFVCPNTETFYTASVFWGVVGPRLHFSAGKVYNVLLYAFAIGAVAPLIPWYLTRKYQWSFLRYVKCVFSFLRFTKKMFPCTFADHSLASLSCSTELHGYHQRRLSTTCHGR